MGVAVREWWEELREDSALHAGEEEEEEEGEDGTALTWVTGWTQDVVWVSWLVCVCVCVCGRENSVCCVGVMGDRENCVCVWRERV